MAALTVDELGQTIVSECEKYAKRIIAKYGMSQEETSELSSFLRTEIWSELHSKPELHNIRIVRRLINLRSVDYFRNKGRFDNQTVFSALNTRPHNFDQLEDYEYEIEYDSEISLENSFILSQELTSFIQTLTERQRQILLLVTQGYGTNDICRKLGVSINTPKNTMKKVRKLAIDFGLSLT